MNFIRIFSNNYKEKSVSSSLHSHLGYEIFIAVKGKRVIPCPNCLHEMAAPSIFIIPPHYRHGGETTNSEWYTISVLPSFLEKEQLDLLEKYSLKNIPLSHEEAQFTIVLLKAMFNLQQTESNPEPNTEYYFVSLFNTFLFFLTQKKADEPPNLSVNMPPLLYKITRYLNEHFHEKITLNNLAEIFFISKSTIIYNFKKHLQCAPMDYLLSIRLSAAKNYLLSRKKRSILEISELCGFSSANYFTEMFKTKEGISPTIYRKVNLQ